MRVMRVKRVMRVHIQGSYIMSGPRGRSDLLGLLGLLDLLDLLGLLDLLDGRLGFGGLILALSVFQNVCTPALSLILAPAISESMGNIPLI